MDCKFTKRPVTAANSIEEKGKNEKTSLYSAERLKYNLIATTMAVCLANSSSSSGGRSRRRLRANLSPPLLLLTLGLALAYLLFRCLFPSDTSYRKSVRLESSAYSYIYRNTMYRKHFLGRNGLETLFARFLLYLAP